MNRKYLSGISAILLTVALLTGCTDQSKKMEDFPQESSASQQTVSGNSVQSSQPVNSKIGNNTLHDMGTWVAPGVKNYSYRILSAKTYATLKSAGINVKDLSQNENENWIDGKSEVPFLQDGSLKSGNILLLVNGEVRLDDASSADFSPMVSSLYLFQTIELENLDKAKFKPALLYNSKAPAENREKEYWYLPQLDKVGATESFQVGWIIPKTYLKDGKLAVIIQENMDEGDAIVLKMGGSAVR